MFADMHLMLMPVAAAAVPHLGGNVNLSSLNSLTSCCDYIHLEFRDPNVVSCLGWSQTHPAGVENFS